MDTQMDSLGDDMEATTITLTDFLLARIAEDEKAVRGIRAPWWMENTPLDPARVLAEVAAKRHVIAAHFGGIVHSCPGNGTQTYYDQRNACPTLRALALPYAAHPDFKPEWRA